MAKANISGVGMYSSTEGLEWRGGSDYLLSNDTVYLSVNSA